MRSRSAPSPGRSWLTAGARAAASLAGATVAGAALVVHDPHQAHSYAACPVLALTGVYCPGCGSLRGIHDLATGHPCEAVAHNALLVPALVWLGWWWFRQAAQAAGVAVPSPPSSAGFGYGLLVALTLFTVLRNVPGSPMAWAATMPWNFSVSAWITTPTTASTSGNS